MLRPTEKNIKVALKFRYLEHANLTRPHAIGTWPNWGNATIDQKAKMCADMHEYGKKFGHDLMSTTGPVARNSLLYRLILGTVQLHDYLAFMWKLVDDIRSYAEVQEGETPVLRQARIRALKALRINFHRQQWVMIKRI